LKTRKKIISIIKEAMNNGARKKECCKIIGVPRRTLYDWEHNEKGDKRSLITKNPANKLSKKEEKKVKRTLCLEAYVDLSPYEVVADLADKGIYLCSVSTMYRVLKRNDMDTYRLEQKPKKYKNVETVKLKANSPNEIWSWDITYLKTNIRRKYFYLYTHIDTWSKKIVGYKVYEDKNGKNASDLFEDAITREKAYDVHLHSDNGMPMKSYSMLSLMENLKIDKSYSRPRVSNDNAYSEALYKTLKYRAGYPGYFRSIEEAKEWIDKFVKWYNHEHKHSGINFVTPVERHEGKDKEILEKRRKLWQKQKKKHPERFGGNLKKWKRTEEVYLAELPESRIKKAV